MVTSHPVLVQGAGVRGAHTQPHDQAVEARSLLCVHARYVLGSLIKDISCAHLLEDTCSLARLYEGRFMPISVSIVTINMSVSALIMCA